MTDSIYNIPDLTYSNTFSMRARVEPKTDAANSSETELVNGIAYPNPSENKLLCL